MPAVITLAREIPDKYHKSYILYSDLSAYQFLYKNQDICT